MPDKRHPNRLVRFAGDVFYIIGSLAVLAAVAPVLWIADRMGRSA